MYRLLHHEALQIHSRGNYWVDEDSEVLPIHYHWCIAKHIVISFKNKKAIHIHLYTLFITFLLRPGSIIGPQQQFMKEMQPKMWKEGLIIIIIIVIIIIDCRSTLQINTISISIRTFISYCDDCLFVKGMHIAQRIQLIPT